MGMRNNKCPECGSPATILITTMNQLLCADCRSYTEFKLKPNQQAPLEDGKKGEADAS